MGRSESERLARVEALLEVQQRRIEELEAENRRLREHGGREGRHQPVGAGGTVGRRRLLVGGATAGAAAVAGALVSGQPTAAADGGTFVLGQTNSAAATTRLAHTGSSVVALNLESGTATEALEVSNTGGGRAILASAQQASGVAGFSVTGGGVYGESRDGDGVTGVATGDGSGVVGRSPGTGVSGVSDGGGLAISGYAFGEGVGLAAQSEAGVGVAADGGTGAGLRVQGRTTMQLVAGGSRPAPTLDTTPHERGDVVIDSGGAVWLCTLGGTPGSWQKIGGPQTAGQLHVLLAPARVYDSRPGALPTSVGPKTPFAPDETRTLDLKANSSGVPAGASAALVTILLVNASTTPGNATIWANGVAKPLANTMVWGGTAGRFTATAVTALDSQARVRFNASQATNLVLDVVGYYR